MGDARRLPRSSKLCQKRLFAKRVLGINGTENGLRPPLAVGLVVPGQDRCSSPVELRESADRGDAGAQYNLGVMYDGGEGQVVPQNYGEASKWYRKAAEQGFAKAQHNLGRKCSRGEGVPRDYDEAARRGGKAAGQGEAPAQFNLGGIPLKRRGCAARLPDGL